MRASLFILAIALLSTSAACRLNPECFGQNECDFGYVCQEGRCLEASLVRDGGTTSTQKTWHTDIRPIVETYCVSCHSNPPVNSAPIPLVTYADVTASGAAGPYYLRMAARMGDARFPMPPAGSPAPTQAEIDCFTEWANNGAPEGVEPPRDGGPRDGGPPRDAGPERDAGPVNPIPLMGRPTDVYMGLQQGEGPVYRAQENDVLFVDVPGNTVYRYDPVGGGTTVFRAMANTPAALRLDAANNLLTTEFALRRISIMTNAQPPANDYITMFGANRLNGPNDLDLHSDGTIYFSDPAVYALINPPTDSETGVAGLYRRAPDGTVTQEATFDLFATPNGVALSPDELTLYLAFTNEGEVRAYDVMPDRSLANERVFANGMTAPDGMDHDEFQNLYVASGDGIEVFAPDGTRWGAYGETLPQQPSNLTFGGADRRTMYVTTQQRLIAVPVQIPGGGP